MEIAGKVGSRYLAGLVIAEWNSHKGSSMFRPDGLSTEEDHIIKRLFVKAQKVPLMPGTYNLVGIVEIEVVSIENGQDEGYYELPTHEVYRMPFPIDLQSRKQTLRQMQKHPNFHLVR